MYAYAFSCANTAWIAWCFCFRYTILNGIINQITIWKCVIVTICIRTYPHTHAWYLRFIPFKTHFSAVIVYFGNEIGNSISIHNSFCNVKNDKNTWRRAHAFKAIPFICLHISKMTTSDTCIDSERQREANHHILLTHYIKMMVMDIFWELFEFQRTVCFVTMVKTETAFT